ncbi:MAG: LOG family protein [Bdellovibrionota bacterium]|jgi:uncharacterized protein (TIGR00730 family)
MAGKKKNNKDEELSEHQIKKQRRKHLDERLHLLNSRTLMIEEELKSLDDPRFFRVCIFGSARLKPETEAYHEVFQLARFLAWEGIDVLTGGGPGLMEAANKGAQLGKKENRTRSLSFGIGIQLEWEMDLNHHIDIKKHHYRFSSRLDEFMRLSHAVVCTPGGIGTLLELFFTWQLVQVGHIPMRPIVLLDSDFWTELIDWVKTTVLGRQLVSPKDFDFISIVDTPEEAFYIISKEHQKFRDDYQAKVKLADECKDSSDEQK